MGPGLAAGAVLLSSSFVLVTTPSASAAEARGKTLMVICFDVEDYTSPESVGMDEIPKWIAETMTEVGVTGSFFVIAVRRPGPWRHVAGVT